MLNGNKKFWGNTYSYDAWGNLLNKTKIGTACAGENLSLTADAHNWIHATGGSDYLYDAAGNMTFNATPPTQTYSYDQENRLTGAAGYAYTYDGDGNRVRKSTGSTGTLYWYMTPGIVGESDLSGNLTDEYVFFDGERVARKSTNGVFYYFSDHLKTASVITDSAGVIRAESDYYPWGGELQFVANDSNHYKFTGKERDSETQLDYFGARHYSNGLGRWVTPDWSAKPAAVPYAVLGDPQSLNLYTYVRNIPTTGVDPDGHCGSTFCQIAAGVATGVGKFVWNNSPAGMAVNGMRQSYADMKNPAAAQARTQGEIKGAATVGAALSGNTTAQAQVLGAAATAWNNASTTDKASMATQGVLTAGTIALSGGVGSAPAAAEGLADSALVVRGGVPTATQLTKGAESIAADGTLSGVSVQSANGASVEQLSQGIPNNQIGVTTVGDVRAAGGDVVSTGTAGNPCHCDMNGVTAEQGSKLFQVQPNPSKVKK
jgi:RHS repeat-associated protein